MAHPLDIANQAFAAYAKAHESATAWVLQRNDRPHTVFFDAQAAQDACQREREADRMWREENAHVADVKVFWNTYPAAIAKTEA